MTLNYINQNESVKQLRAWAKSKGYVMRKCNVLLGGSKAYKLYDKVSDISKPSMRWRTQAYYQYHFAYLSKPSMRWRTLEIANLIIKHISKPSMRWRTKQTYF